MRKERVGRTKMGDENQTRRDRGAWTQMTDICSRQCPQRSGLTPPVPPAEPVFTAWPAGAEANKVRLNLLTGGRREFRQRLAVLKRERAESAAESRRR